jgi:hypothetical protein
MLKKNQEQSTSGQVSCRHCGAVLFRKKDSPLPGESGTFCESFALRAKPKKFQNFDTKALINFSFGHYKAHAYWPFGMVL